jgi:DNA repair and recombination RAD54-like protein
LQNDLEEFYAMVNFTNPGVLGDATTFRRHYEVCNPLLELGYKENCA